MQSLFGCRQTVRVCVVHETKASGVPVNRGTKEKACRRCLNPELVWANECHGWGRFMTRFRTTLWPVRYRDTFVVTRVQLICPTALHYRLALLVASRLRQ